MISVHKTIQAPYSAEAMYRLVNDVARYPEFVPGCIESMVHSETAEAMYATLTVSAKGLRHTFSTHNTLTPYSRIEMKLIDGPIHEFQGYWTFTPADEQSCAVHLHISFTLKNKLLSMMVAPLFQQAAIKIMDAFIVRADQNRARNSRSE